MRRYSATIGVPPPRTTFAPAPSFTPWTVSFAPDFPPERLKKLVLSWSASGIHCCDLCFATHGAVITGTASLSLAVSCRHRPVPALRIVR